MLIRACTRVLGLALLALGGSSGCDIVQGFQEAGDALFPEERTHLNAPGLRLVAGNYRDLRFASGEDLYLLARKPDDPERNLYAMLYSEPRPCAIPNVAGYITGHIAQLVPSAVAYFKEDVWWGTLNFANTECHVYPKQLDNVRPVDVTTEGFVVWSGDGSGRVSIYNPVKDIEEELATAVEALYVRAFAGHHAAFTAGQFVVFSPEWQKLGVFGTNIVRYERAGSSIFYEEESKGIIRLRPLDGGVDMTVLTPSGCELAARDEPWVHYYSPCSSQRLVVYHEPTAEASPLDIQAHPLDIELVPANGARGGDPKTQPFWFFYLKDVVPETGLGTLTVRDPDGVDHRIGENAALERSDLIDTLGAPFGYGLVDIDATTDLGTYRYFTLDGTQQDLATQTRRDDHQLVVDFDGNVGNLAAAARDELTIVARGVPTRGYEYQDRKQRWTAIFHDFDGESGKLSILGGELEEAEHAFRKSGTAAFELQTIAPSVGYFRTSFLDLVLPGIMYIANHDPERDVGLLEYRNLELGFTAQIADGVSDFLVTADDVLYTVPYGNAAGIWLLQAK